MTKTMQLINKTMQKVNMSKKIASKMSKTRSTGRLMMKPTKITDHLPFYHGQEGTHACCQARLERSGECCLCVPHAGCEIFKQPNPTLDKMSKVKTTQNNSKTTHLDKLSMTGGWEEEFEKELKTSISFALMMLPAPWKRKGGKEWTQDEIIDQIVKMASKTFVTKLIQSQQAHFEQLIAQQKQEWVKESIDVQEKVVAKMLDKELKKFVSEVRVELRGKETVKDFGLMQAGIVTGFNAAVRAQEQKIKAALNKRSIE